MAKHRPTASRIPARGNETENVSIRVTSKESSDLRYCSFVVVLLHHFRDTRDRESMERPRAITPPMMTTPNMVPPSWSRRVSNSSKRAGGRCPVSTRKAPIAKERIPPATIAADEIVAACFISMPLHSELRNEGLTLALSIRVEQAAGLCDRTGEWLASIVRRDDVRDGLMQSHEIRRCSCGPRPREEVIRQRRVVVVVRRGFGRLVIGLPLVGQPIDLMKLARRPPAKFPARA